MVQREGNGPGEDRQWVQAGQNTRTSGSVEPGAAEMMGGGHTPGGLPHAQMYAWSRWIAHGHAAWEAGDWGAAGPPSGIARNPCSG